MRFLLLLIFPLLLFACRKRNPVPKGLLSTEKMEAVMWDMMRADEMVHVYSERDTAYKILPHAGRLYEQVYKIHGINKETFQKSLKFYQRRPDLFQVVLDSLKKFTEDRVRPVS
jgi:hypothetical protein